MKKQLVIAALLAVSSMAFATNNDDHDTTNNYNQQTYNQPSATGNGGNGGNGGAGGQGGDAASGQLQQIVSHITTRDCVMAEQVKK